MLIPMHDVSICAILVLLLRMHDIGIDTDSIGFTAGIGGIDIITTARPWLPASMHDTGIDVGSIGLNTGIVSIDISMNTSHWYWYQHQSKIPVSKLAPIHETGFDFNSISLNTGIAGISISTSTSHWECFFTIIIWLIHDTSIRFSSDI